jgi:hypothetical protein
MPGPMPKSPATRARRNRSSTARTLAVAATVAAPALPAVRDWHAMTVAWWRDVWSSPMAGEFLQADMHGLSRLALLVDDFWLASSPTARKDLAGEIRLQGQAFGLTPIDRRRLQWTVDRVEEKPQARRAARKPGKDPRIGLAS